MDLPTTMAARKQPNPIDIHVGTRLKQRRAMLVMTQEKLGDQLGVTFQQVQKYEKGANRIGASRLQEIAKILDVPVSYFFEDSDLVSQSGRAEMDEAYAFRERGQAGFGQRPADPGDAHALAKAFSQINDARVRRRIIDLVETLADAHSR